MCSNIKAPWLSSLRLAPARSAEAPAAWPSSHGPRPPGREPAQLATRPCLAKKRRAPGILGILFWMFLLGVGVLRLELGVSVVFLWLFAGMLRWFRCFWCVSTSLWSVGSEIWSDGLVFFGWVSMGISGYQWVSMTMVPHGNNSWACVWVTYELALQILMLKINW